MDVRSMAKHESGDYIFEGGYGDFQAISVLRNLVDCENGLPRFSNYSGVLNESGVTRFRSVQTI